MAGKTDILAGTLGKKLDKITGVDNIRTRLKNLSESSNISKTFKKISQLDNTQYSRLTGETGDLTGITAEKLTKSVDNLGNRVIVAVEKINSRLNEIDSGIRVLNTKVERLEKSAEKIDKRVKDLENKDEDKHDKWKLASAGGFSVLGKNDHSPNSLLGALSNILGVASIGKLGADTLGKLGALSGISSGIGSGAGGLAGLARMAPLVLKTGGAIAGGTAIGLTGYGIKKWLEGEDSLKGVQGPFKSGPGLGPQIQSEMDKRPPGFENPIYRWLRENTPSLNPFGDPMRDRPEFQPDFQRQSYSGGGGGYSGSAIPGSPGSQTHNQMGELSNYVPNGNSTILADKQGKVNPQAFYDSMVIKFSNSALKGYVPKDGEKYGIKTGSPQEWARFATMLIKQESGFNINSTGDNGNSYGLVQMKAGEYGLKTREDVMDPNKSSDALIKQFEKYIIPSEHIGGTGSGAGTYHGWRGAAAYFGPIRRDEIFKHSNWFKNTINTGNAVQYSGAVPYVNLERPPSESDIKMGVGVAGKGASFQFNPTHEGSAAAVREINKQGASAIAYYQGGGLAAAGEKEINLSSAEQREKITQLSSQYRLAGYSGFKIDNLHRLQTTDQLKKVFDAVHPEMKIVANGNPVLLQRFLEENPEYKSRIQSEAENLASGQNRENVEAVKALGKMGVKTNVFEFSSASDPKHSATKEQAAALAKELPGATVSHYNQVELPGRGERGGISGTEGRSVFSSEYGYSSETRSFDKLGLNKSGKYFTSGLMYDESKTPGGRDATGVGVPSAPKAILDKAREIASLEGPQAVYNYMRNQGYPKDGAWCGQFAATVVKSAGFQPPKGAAVASNWRNFGTQVEFPEPGDIAVRKRSRYGGYTSTGDTGSHVTIVSEINNNKVKLLGGNQGGAMPNIYSRNIGEFEYFRAGGVASKQNSENTRFKEWLQSVYPETSSKPEGPLTARLPGTQISSESPQFKLPELGVVGTATPDKQTDYRNIGLFGSTDQSAVQDAQRYLDSIPTGEAIKQAEQEQKYSQSTHQPENQGTKYTYAQPENTVGGMSESDAKRSFGAEAIQETENMVTPLPQPSGSGFKGENATAEQKVAPPPTPDPKEPSGYRTEKAPQLQTRDEDGVRPSNHSGSDRTKPTVSNGGPGDSHRGPKHFCNI